jgi:hypothetical protein
MRSCAIMVFNHQDRQGIVILSAAKDLLHEEEILRCAQDDRCLGAQNVNLDHCSS